MRAPPAASHVLGLGLGAVGVWLAACRDAPAARPPARDARPQTAVTAARAGVGPTRTREDTPTPRRPAPVPAGTAPRGAAGGAGAAAGAAAGDAPPQMRGRAPFRYPGGLYKSRAEGDVTLRLWVDSAGRVRPESTRVAETSGVRLLDSAAVAGSARLAFTPARRAGRPAAAALLFPVHFRHPAGRR